MFDGKVLVLHRGAFEGDAFHGAYLQTRYSRFIAWRDFGFPDRTMRNCFAMAALRAADGAFLLGVMGPHTANAGKGYFPAGTPDTADIVARRSISAGSVARELGEETGLETDVPELRGRLDDRRARSAHRVHAPRRRRAAGR